MRKVDTSQLVFYDLETKYLADEIEGGWTNCGAMEISVLCVVRDFKGRQITEFYDSYNRKKFLERYYCNKDFTLISFNGLGFDNKVIEGSWTPKNSKLAYEIDLCFEGKKTLKLLDLKVKGCSLDSLATATLGIGKSGDGAEAPILYRNNNFADLYTYCLNDVMLTKQLAEFHQNNGIIIHPEYGQIGLGISWRPSP